MTTLPIVGVDLAKSKFDFALLQGKRVIHDVLPNDASSAQALHQWLAARHIEQAHICMEATGTYGDDLAAGLYALGHQVSILNPTVLKAFRQSTLTRTKNDRTDAVLLARYCAVHQPELWTPPAPEIRELQALVRRLDSLQQMRQQEYNRLTSGERSTLVTDSIATVLQALDTEIERVAQLIRDHIQQHPHLREQHDLLTTIPGIGDKTATTILAECGDLRTYPSARELAAYAGLTPKEFRSGSSVNGKPRLSKIGSSRLRQALYFPAISAKRYNPIIHAFCDRLLQRGKHTMTIIGAAMRKLLHLAYGVVKSGKPFNPNHCAEQVIA